MNPFVTLLILLALVVDLILWGGATLWTIKYSLTGSAVAMHLIFGGIAVALVYILARTSRGLLLDDRSLKSLDIVARRKLTNNILAGTYVTIFVFLVVVTNFMGTLDSMRYWLGAVSFLVAAAFVWCGVWELRKVKTLDPAETPQLTDAEPIERQRLRRHFRRTRGYLILSSFLTGLFTTVLFWGFHGDRFLSSFDFVALLVLLGSVVFWISLKGRTI